MTAALRILLGKCVVLFWVLCAAACAGGVRARPAVAGPAPAELGATETIRPGLTVQTVARDAWVVTHQEAHHSNSLVVRFADGSVLICSSPLDSDTTRALLAWLRERLAPTRMVAINTHWHIDGTGGNQAYREAGVAIYASTHTQALSLGRGAQMRGETAEGLPAPVAGRVLATPVVGAEHLFEESAGLTLTFGGERVEVLHPGAAHSQDNLVVHLPTRGILFGGCMLKSARSLGYLGDASLDSWEGALARLSALAAAIVVPGHGPTGGAEIIANTRQLVRAARLPVEAPSSSP